MSDGHGPTNADLMRRLNEIVGKVDKHDTEIKALKADRELVRRLHTHVHDVAEKVTVIHELLSDSERLVADTLRLSVRELSNQMTAAVRAEMSGLRDEVKELRAAVQARPCLIGDCPVKGESNA